MVDVARAADAPRPAAHVTLFAAHVTLRVTPRVVLPVTVRSSSELMVNQLKGSYTVKGPVLQPLYAEAVALLAHFDHWQAEHVPRQENQEPYRLANKAISELDERMLAAGRLAP